MTDVSRETKALLPCPFCGSPAELERDSDHHGEWFNLGCSRHWGRVKDPDKSCLGARLWYTETDVPEVEAIAAWNRRAGYSAALAAPLTEGERESLAAIIDAEAWLAIKDGRDQIDGSLWHLRRGWAREKASLVWKELVQLRTANGEKKL
jgi:hypothetical protein